ncbi:ubiquinol-cytochrome c reductase iron-sulfur subunit [Bacillus marasmi]|uniref:QcrA and Rieske domain-containing protein n=1 Tax=Bacillus marasmi TaxID=1926279 RepID=UPI001FE759F2|nr:Rieske (2Fe-2S) protein [Bacillus marasmi]
MQRREFISKSLKSTAGLFAVSVLPLGLAACGSKEKTMDTSTMASLGPLAKLESGEFPKKVQYNVKIKDAWTTQDLDGFVYVNKQEDGSLIIMSPTCTHLGCTAGDAEVSSQEKGVRYFCKCHGGEYDEFGKNVSGPPPRPLDTFESVIQDGEVYISVLSPVKREA